MVNAETPNLDMPQIEMATTQTETNYSEQPQAIGTEKGFVEIPQCISTEAKPESPLHQQKHLNSPGLDSTTSNASDATSGHPTNAHLPQCFSADFIPDSFSPEELSVEEEQRTLAGERSPPPIPLQEVVKQSLVSGMHVV